VTLRVTHTANRAISAIYNWYSRKVLPVLGGAISGAPEAYRYLPESVRKFPEAGELAAMMGEAGHARVEWEYLGPATAGCGARAPLVRQTS